MPKSKKKKNADFQKVKLKVGKRLPKGNTDTVISFKTRTIKVTQNFKDPSRSSNYPQTKQKLTLEELLKRCSANKSCSQRLSAVEGFKELLLSEDGQNTVLSNLHEVMVRVSGLLSDPEQVVRQAVLRLCKTVFAFVDSEKDSFFEYLSAQLCCTMNHISDHVRRDSLILFDLLLEKYPQQVVSRYCNMVPNLIDLISSQMLGDRTGSSVRTLICNPDSKLSSQQWRAQVLQRLKKIVDIFIDKHKADVTPVETEQKVYCAGIDHQVNLGPVVPAYIKQLWTSYPKADSFRLSSKMQEYAYLTRHAGCLRKFILSLLPLIKQCWVEEHCSGSATTSGHGVMEMDHQLREESLPVLKTLVGLLHSLVRCWQCVFTFNNMHYDQNCWFNKEFLRELKELLLPHFPIYIMERARKDNKNTEDSLSALQISVLKLNLMVCEALVGVSFKEQGWPEANASKGDWHKVIVSFLLKNLVQCKGPELCKLVTPVLHKVFFHFPASGKQKKLLAKTQNRFIKAHPLSSEKKILLELLESLAFDFAVESPYHVKFSTRHQLLEPFISSLPPLLLELGNLEKEKGEQLACQVTKAMCQSNSTLLTTALDQYMEQLLDTKTGVFVRLPESCHQHIVLAVMWTYRFKPAPEKVLELVELLCRLPQVTADIAVRLISRLHDMYIELIRKGQFLEYKESYLTFYLSLLVGHKRVDLKAFHDDNSLEKGGLTRILWIATDQQIEKHALIVKTCRKLFFPYFMSPSFMWGTLNMDIVSKSWTQNLLDKYCALSVFTAYAGLMQWDQLLVDMEAVGEVLHFDESPPPPHVRQTGGIGLTVWQQQLSEMLPLLKARLRPFTKLAFSVAYSIVSLETAEEEIAMPEEAVVKVMWNAVVTVMKRSLRMLVDLSQVMSDFVKAQKTEKDSMRVTMVMTRLLSSKEMSEFIIEFHDTVKKQTEALREAIQVATPQVEGQQWWQAFLGIL